MSASVTYSADSIDVTPTAQECMEFEMSGVFYIARRHTNSARMSASVTYSADSIDVTPTAQECLEFEMSGVFTFYP